MVFTANQTAAFFRDDTQMHIPEATVVALAVEGITTVQDLEEFESDDFKQLVSNLRSPTGDGPFVLGAKSLKRLKVAAKAVRYYTAIGRDLTPGNMHYTNVLKNFDMQWNALVKRNDEDAPATPKITRALRVPRWSESFRDFMHRVNGVRSAPLAYVIRQEVDVPAVAPPLMVRQPYSTEHGSMEEELIARLSHGSPVYRDDNKAVYNYLEEATRGTAYHSTVQTYQRSKNGRSAWLALLQQHAGTDKWEKELKDQENFMKTRVWKGNTNFSLERFLEQHRSAYNSLKQCADHVQFQLPDEHTRVRYLMTAIQCKDPEIQAALANIRSDADGPEAKRNNFENAVSFLLPADPVSKKRKLNNDKDAGAQISAANLKTKPGIKPNKGSTGVELRYYKKSEYNSLNDDQKMELKEWRLEKGKNKRSNPKADKDEDILRQTKIRRREIASVFQEERKKEIEKQKKEQAQTQELTSILSSLTIPSSNKQTASAASASATIDAKVTAAATQLQGIFNRGSKPSSATTE
jgi:hypothetical protein